MRTSQVDESAPAAESYVPLRQAARMLGVSVDSVRRLIKRGELSVRRMPASWPSVSVREVDELNQRYTRRRPADADA